MSNGHEEESPIRDEIESLVAPLDGNDPLLENEIYEWIGDVNVVIGTS